MSERYPWVNEKDGATRAILRALAAKSRGEPFDEEELDYASGIVIAASLLEAGASEKTVQELLLDDERERRYVITFKDGELTVDVLFGDEEDGDGAA